jgi:hypothetical protein
MNTLALDNGRIRTGMGPIRRPGVWIRAAALLACAGAQAQVMEDVPFITTPDNVTVAMLALAGVGRQDHVIDLGSGDGRIVITAAKRFGASGLGVEIVPDLVDKSRVNAAKAPVNRRANSNFGLGGGFHSSPAAARASTPWPTSTTCSHATRDGCR